MALDWTGVWTPPKPTKRQVALYRRWREYLRNSKLSVAEQHTRAAAFAEQGREVPAE